jgi:hypothetical protein
MSTNEKRPPYLQVVVAPRPTEMPPTEVSHHRGPHQHHSLQLELFDAPNPAALWLLLVTSESLRLFASTVDRVRPRFIFDLRPLPVFDAVGMSRQVALRHIATIGAVYLDALGSADMRERRNAFIHSGALTRYVDSICGRDLRGPLLFLFDSKDDLIASSRLLPSGLRTPGHDEWKLRVLDGVRGF